MTYAVSLGADPATWTRSQFVRMPFGIRGAADRKAYFGLDRRWSNESVK